MDKIKKIGAMHKMARFIFLLLFISSSSFGFWSESSRKLIEHAAKKYKVEGPASYVSLWGGTKRKWAGSDNAGEVREYFAKDFFKNETIEIYFSSVNKKAPLTIVFPGIFGQHDGDLSPNIIHLLEKNKESHVAVIPNFLSKSYIKARPKYGKDVSEVDIKAAATIVRKVFRSISPDLITHVNLVGESLGSFVATGVLSEIDTKSTYAGKDINLLVMWPPLRLANVLKNFDDRLLETIDTFDNCSFWYRYPQVFYHFIWQETPKNTTKEFVECMDSYLFHGVFAKGIENSLKAKEEVTGEKMVRIPFTFKDYFRMYNKDFYIMIKYKDEKLNLDYWLRKRKLGRSNVRIISSKDDFINNNESWSSFLSDSYLSEEDLILLDWGGHSGGLALPVWEKVFKNEILKINAK